MKTVSYCAGTLAGFALLYGVFHFPLHVCLAAAVFTLMVFYTFSNLFDHE